MDGYDKRLSVFIASPDSYSDVLSVFVECFQKNCSDCPYELILATNTTQYDGARMIHNHKTNDTWAERAVPALKQISTKYVLLMNDDIFIMQPVDYCALESVLDDMDAYGLNFCGLSNRLKGKKLHPTSRLVSVHKQTPYAINLQLGIFNREYLLGLLGDGTLSGWDLERRWMQDALEAPDEYFADVASCNQKLISYVHAVAKGEWFPSARKAVQEIGVEIKGQRKTMHCTEELNIKMIKKTGKLFSPCRRKQIKKMLSKFGFKFATES